MKKVYKIILAFAIISFTGVITYKHNLIYANLHNMNDIGFLNLFIYSFIYGNVFLPLLSPFIAGMLSVDLANRTFSKKNIQTSCLVGLILVLILVILFIICFFIDMSPAIRTNYYRQGLFIRIYDASMFLYCCSFILHNFLYGTIYAYISLAIYFSMDDDSLAIALPGFLHYALPLIITLFPHNMQQNILYFVQYLSFDITTNTSIIQYVTRIFTMILIGWGIHRYAKKHLGGTR